MLRSFFQPKLLFFDSKFARFFGEKIFKSEHCPPPCLGYQFAKWTIQKYIDRRVANGRVENEVPLNGLSHGNGRSVFVVPDWKTLDDQRKEGTHPTYIYLHL
jgi:hypothetical protein